MAGTVPGEPDQSLPPATAGSVPATLARVVPAWCQEMLNSHGYPAAVVAGVRAEAMPVAGAVADMARLWIEYDPASVPGPASVIAKIRAAEGQRLAMDQAMGLHERESWFYRDWRDRVRLRSPRCLGVGDGTSTPLLLEDLGAIRSGDQVSGLRLADAERLVDVLAQQHAAFWESSACHESALAAPGEEAYAGMVAHIVGSGVDALAGLYRDRAPAAAIKAVEALGPRWIEVVKACARGPRTVVHNDCRLDNIFFDLDGVPIFIDWQAIGVSRGTHDVGNLLAGSMNIEDLRTNWESLLHRYHQRLGESGVQHYPWERCLADYRQSVLFPLGQGIALVGALNRHDDRGLTDHALLRPLLHCHDLNSFDTV